MKITSINLPPSKGLSSIKMSRLGDVVLIAGRNGSGKSRLLAHLSEIARSKPYQPELTNLLANLRDIQTGVDTNPNHPNIVNWKNEINNLNDRLRYLQYVNVSDDSKPVQIVNFVPKDLNLIDCNDFTKNQLNDAADSLKSPGTYSLSRGTFSSIQSIQDRWWNAIHPSSSITSEERDEIICEYGRLKEIIFNILGTELSRDSNGNATLFNFPLGRAELSDGQKVLLQLCAAIHSQKVAISEVIIMMDEPENHLHPSALIDVIKQIQASVTEGQIWIATHSIPLLSAFDPSLIWYMYEGSISYAGRSPEKVLRGLLGDVEQISKLSSFLTLPAQFASNQFAFECLLSPQVLMTPNNDVQTTQIKATLKQLLETGSDLTILDYGAGKGRLLDNIYFSEDINERDQISTWLNYVAFDVSQDDESYCRSTIERVYEDSLQRYYNNATEVRADHGDNTFDVVVMCNVLHEIHPSAWLSVLGGTGLIHHLLKDNGYLLIVEDCQLPVGEKAHKHGFLVLQRLQVMKLFDIHPGDVDFTYSDARNDRRLLAYRIPKRALTNVSIHSRREALDTLADAAKDEILRLRDSEACYKNGLLHGFWVQQFANAQLALNELG
ncbi:AAA family ATPase [Paenibacillus plantarum]|nr:AAA family ATPase [Paenibacillus plantarum]